MTSPARKAEADRVEVVYYWALNRLGNALAIDALEIWQEMPASKTATRTTWWLARILRLIFGFRSEATELALAYYRLVRALRTGYTVGVGDEVGGNIIRLEELRQDFERIVDEIERETSSDPVFTTGEDDYEQSFFEDDTPEVQYVDDDDDIEIELVTDIESLIEDLDKAAEEEARNALDTLGPRNLEKKLDTEKTPETAHEKAGNRQAAAALRITLNAARGLNYSLAGMDDRVAGWVRYSQTGSPCGFCAMLLSRGVVYKSARGAQHQGKDQEEDKYHDNCRCVAVPVFDIDQYDGELFDLNRELRELWDNQISGKYDPSEALREFRRIMRERAKDANSQAPEVEAA